VNILCKLFRGSCLCGSLVMRDGRNHLCAPPRSAYRPSNTVFCFALGGAT
jgi:hypothetical protein